MHHIAQQPLLSVGTLQGSEIRLREERSPRCPQVKHVEKPPPSVDGHVTESARAHSYYPS